jgi:integrase
MSPATNGAAYMGRSFAFTEARVAAACKAASLDDADASGRRSWRDDGCQGLTLVVNVNTGTATYYFQGKVNGQTTRKVIGDVDVVRLEEARQTVNRRRYDSTFAAAAAPRPAENDDAEPTDQTPLVKAVMDDMLAAHAAGRWLPGTRSKVPTDRTMLNYANLRRAVMRDKVRRKKPGTEDYRLVDGEDFEQLTLTAFADRLGDIYGKLKARAPIQANRALQLWRNLYAYAADSKLWDRSNPTMGTGRTDRLTRTVEQPRQRVLTDAEAKRLDAALEADLPLWRDLFRLSLATLQRMGACCRARWDDITLTGKDAAWRIPAEDMKGRKGGHTVPLADIPEALELLRARRAAVPKGCPWVFPAAEGDDGHARNYDKAWDRIIRRAELWTKDRTRRPRPHDLRRSGGSRMVEAGVPLVTITAALGNVPESAPMVARTYAIVPTEAVKDAFKAVSRRGSRRQTKT